MTRFVRFRDGVNLLAHLRHQLFDEIGVGRSAAHLGLDHHVVSGCHAEVAYPAVGVIAEVRCVRHDHAIALRDVTDMPGPRIFVWKGLGHILAHALLPFASNVLNHLARGVGIGICDHRLVEQHFRPGSVPFGGFEELPAYRRRTGVLIPARRGRIADHARIIPALGVPGGLNGPVVVIGVAYERWGSQDVACFGRREQGALESGILDRLGLLPGAEKVHESRHE